MEISTFTNI